MTRMFFAALRNKAKSPEQFGPIRGISGTLSTSLSQCLENWASYYKNWDRAKPGTFDYPHVENPDLDKPFTYVELVLAVNKLRDNKAPGEDLIATDDLTILLHTDPDDPDFVLKNREILNSLLDLISSFWSTEKMPPPLKKTILRPFIKGSDKDCTNPADYRPISLLNTLMKLYEGLTKRRLVDKLENEGLLSSAQAAYRTKLSIFDQLFVIQELILYYRFVKRGPRGGIKITLYLCFLDLRKAFDTVPREILFKKLLDFGVSGKMLRVIIDPYSRNSGKVLIDEYFTRDFSINTGVLQGSKLGPILFNIFINDLLVKLNASEYGALLGDIRISALGFADDIVLASDNPHNMQKLLNIAHNWANANLMSFSPDKCKAMVFNRSPKGINIFIGSTKIKFLKFYKYLGIILSSKRLTNLYSEHFKQIMLKAERRLQCIRHYGFHKDGLRTETSVRMYKLLVRPILEFGSQVLIYRNYFMVSKSRKSIDVAELQAHAEKLEHFQTKLLKRLPNCPRHEPPAIVRLFAGVEPISARLDFLKLRYFWRLSKTSRTSISKIVYDIRRKEFLRSNKGFLHESICCKYNARAFGKVHAEEIVTQWFGEKR